MKNLFFSALLFAGAGLAFTSCNNGAYDANPATNNSGVPNPMNTGNGGGTATLGNIQGKFNGTFKVFPANYNDLLFRSLIGAVPVGNTSIQSIDIDLLGYTGPKTYLLNDTVTDVIVTYRLTDVTTGNVPDDYGIQSTKSRATVVVTEDANNQMKGTFSAVIFRMGPVNDNDSVVIDNGSFYLSKQ